MTLPAAGNPISISQINTEFTLGNSLSAYRGVTWWTDAGATGTFDSTNLDMSEFYSKRKNSPFTVSLSQLQSVTITSSGGSPTECTLFMNSNGIWYVQGNEGIIAEGNWGTPTTVGIGSSYWVRFTRTYQDIPSPSSSSTPSTGWLQLSSNRSVSVLNGSNGGVFGAIYTIEISTDSGGSSIIASCTGTWLQAFVEVVGGPY